MNSAKRHETIRVRSCCACDSTCDSTIVTPAELARHRRHIVPRGMRLFAGTYRDRPFCGDCIPAEAKHERASR